MAAALHAMGCYEVSLGDTTGVGTPASVAAMFQVAFPLQHVLTAGLQFPCSCLGTPRAAATAMVEVGRSASSRGCWVVSQTRSALLTACGLCAGKG